MDPLTHGIVGAAISAFSGTTVSLDNPFTLGAILGSMAPDLDIVLKLLKNDAAYLEHHRGKSHTVPYLIGFSIIITLGISFLPFSDFSFISTMIWTLLGALSHTLLDILNSYGAKFVHKKVKLNLLTLYDPVLTVIALFYIVRGVSSYLEVFQGLVVFLAYLYLRWILRKKNERDLIQHLKSSYRDVSVYMMPSLKAFYKWDFVAHTSTHDIVGQYNPWKGKQRSIKIMKTLEKNDPLFTDAFLRTKLGDVFTSFSPNLHVTIKNDPFEDNIVLHVIDLRYFLKNKFLHNATLIFDQDMKLIASYLHPYSMKNMILIPN